MFNIINRRTFLVYCISYPEAANALKEWYKELLHAAYANFNELKAVFKHASIVADNRVIFNIMGNKYRLVVRMVFEFKVIQVKWFGTHSEYDQIDVVNIKFKGR